MGGGYGFDGREGGGWGWGVPNGEALALDEGNYRHVGCMRGGVWCNSVWD